MDNQAFDLLMLQLKKMENDQEILRQEFQKQAIVLVQNTQSLITHMSRTEGNEVLIAQNKDYIARVEKHHQEFVSLITEDLKFTKAHVVKMQRWGRTLTPSPKKIVGLAGAITIVINYFTNFKQWVITFLK